MKIEWKFGGSLNNYFVPNEPGVYLHILRGRIVYIGEGNIKECQNRHCGNLKNLYGSFYNLIEIDKSKVSDIYTLICNNNYKDNFERKILFGQPNSKDYPNIESIVQMNLDQTSLYYFVTNDKLVSQKIEAGLQDYLITKYNMDEYSPGFFPIGQRGQERNIIDFSLELENDFKEILV